MPKIVSNPKKEMAFLPLYEKFIAASKSGRRIQPNGKRISPHSVMNYYGPLRLLEKFCLHYQFVLRLRQLRYLNKRDILAEKKYWKNFYLKFSNYLYKVCGHHDNYVGHTFKTLRTFFNYLNKDQMLDVGEFHKIFYVRKEDLPVIALLPEELNFLIYDSDFTNSLSFKLREVKNIFVFGCTVALRFSDLMALNKTNLRIVNDSFYLAVRSKKTGIDTQMKLPDYAVKILEKFKGNGNKLLPVCNSTLFNELIKLICEKAGFTQPANKLRSIRGILVNIKNKTEKNPRGKQYRFCDMVTSHTMRRTAITTMLCLGVPEQLVRKISGHSPMSKEFFRYISLAQTYQDKELSSMFELLKERKLNRNNKNNLRLFRK